MKFLIEKEAFIDPLSRVASVIETAVNSPTIPILAQVLIETIDDGGIRLWGSNIEMEACERIVDVEVSEKGKMVCSAQMLLEYCRRQRDGSRFQFNLNGNHLVVENIDSGIAADDHPVANGDATGTEEQRNTLSEMVLEADDFPHLSVGDDEWSLQFDVDRFALRNIFKRTEHAMGKDEPRTYLNSTLLDISKNKVQAVTTDAHRMAVSEALLDKDISEDSEERHRALVPRKTSLELIKVLGTLTSRVTVRLKNTHIQVSTSYYSFTSKLLQGNFPNWQGSMPTHLDLAFSADRTEFSSGLRLIGILSMGQGRPSSSDKNKNRIIAQVHVEQGLLEMSADHTQKKVEHKMKVDDNLNKHLFKVNYRYLLDALDAMPECEKVHVHLKDTSSACHINFPDDQSTNFLVMLLKES